MAEQTSVPVKTVEARPARWDPFAELEALQDEFLRAFDRRWPFRDGGRRRQRPAPEPIDAWLPRMDVYEQGGAYVVKAELPGVEKGDIQVALEGDDLVIQGERRAESEIKERDYYRMERSSGGFYRRLPLPAGIAADKVEASYKDGILEVRIPKPAEAAAQATKIPVK